MHPLDRYINSTRSMLGFGKRLLLFRVLVAALLYKYPIPTLLLHIIPDLSHAPRLPELCELCNLERVVSLKRVLRERGHAFAWFWGNSCLLYISSIVSLPYLYCDEFTKSFTKLFRRMVMFSKASLSVMLLRFLRCICLFASLKEI